MNDSDAIHKIAKMFVKAGVTSSDIDVAKANANIACVIEKRRIEYLFTKQEMQKYLKLDEEKYEECISGDYD